MVYGSSCARTRHASTPAAAGLSAPCCPTSPHPHPSPPYLVHSSSLVVPKKPQMSAPTIGMPHMLVLSRPWMEKRRLAQLASLSPVQCAAQRPRLGKEDLRVGWGGQVKGWLW